MNRKILFLDLVLLALAGWLSWALRLKWIELHQHEHTVLQLAPDVQKRLMPPPPVPMFKAPAGAEYNDAVQRTLFAQDRNPNVILPPPPPPPAPPPMPELPAYYGIMAIGDPVVLLSLPRQGQKKYHAGEKVGPFKLVSFSREKITFDWDGKIVERKPEELKEKEPAQQVIAAPPQVQQQPGNANTNAGGVTSIGGSNSSSAPKVSEKLGRDVGGGFRTCVAGDTTPPGTIIDGYKKKVTTNMFGTTCTWELVNP